jgi:hypothetical protein
MTVAASLSGAGFSGPREMHVPAGGTGVYPLSFSASIAGGCVGQLPALPWLAPTSGVLLAGL